jgi:hypothetical protein
MTFRKLRIDFDWNTSAHTFRVVNTSVVRSELHAAIYAGLPVCVDRCEVIHPSAPHVKARWRLEKPSAATATFYIGDELASCCLFVAGLDCEADARAIDDFVFSSGIDLAADGVLHGQVLTNAPALASLRYGQQGPLDAFEEDDRQRADGMEVCLAATFFEVCFQTVPRGQIRKTAPCSC